MYEIQFLFNISIKQAKGGLICVLYKRTLMPTYEHPERWTDR